MPPVDFAIEPVAWVLTADVRRAVTLADGTVIDRDEFLGRLWAEFGDAGLTGITEGEIDAAEAAALGLAEAPRVLDVAAAPAGRDWVGGRDVARVACWFDSEAVARAAARTLAVAAGCEVREIRRVVPAAADDWRRAFTAIEVPGFGTVLPAWEPGVAGTAAGRTRIFIEPGTGFGTGGHETTRLCLAAIAAWADAGGRLDHVLDFGSGSGILAIAAVVRGGGVADAVEIDSAVHDAIRANAARNGVAERLAVAATMPAATAHHDLVVANIVAEVLLRHADALCAAVRRDASGAIAGGVILSGLLADDVPGVAAAYATRLAAPPVETTRGDWHCLRFTAGR